MSELADLVAQLQGVEHFRRLPEADIRAIVAGGQVRRFLPGATIFVEGEPCAGMVVLLEGQVQLRKLGPQGQESILDVIEPVIMFNEVAVLDGGPNLATALATKDCVTWQVSYANFQALLSRYPQIGLGLLRVLARRNRFLVSQYEDLSFRSVLARVAKLLLDLSDDGQAPIDRHRYPNHELAARIATVPEPFSRSLNVFKRRGTITTTRAAILINHPQALHEISEGRSALPNR